MITDPTDPDTRKKRGCGGGGEGAEKGKSDDPDAKKGIDHANF